MNGHKETAFAAQVFFRQSVNEDDEDVSVEPSRPQLSQINGRRVAGKDWRDFDRSQIRCRDSTHWYVFQ